MTQTHTPEQEQTQPAGKITIEGTITLPDGTTSNYIVIATPDESSASQWGATADRLGRTVDILESLHQAAAQTAHDDEGDS